MKKNLINILFIEDDEVDVMTLRRALQKNNINHPFYLANNGIEALEMLQQKGEYAKIPNHRRLILLDLNMPKMNGIEFLQKLRSYPELKSIPVVVITMSSEEKDKLEAYNLNVAGYMLKPDGFSDFLEMIAILYKYWSICELP